MDNILDQILTLFNDLYSSSPSFIQKLPLSGSSRIYFRLGDKNRTLIATYNPDIKENKTFLYFARNFKEKNLPVPDIYAVSSEFNLYFQQDLGSLSLFDLLKTEGKTLRLYSLYQKSLKELARFQFEADTDLDYEQSHRFKIYDSQSILNDLLYFKKYFLDQLGYRYDEESLVQEFLKLSQDLFSPHYCRFMFRDFQSRNILINNNEVYFIDFQGGMKGNIVYDVVSLLWQAKADLCQEWKKELFEYYLIQVQEMVEEELDLSILYQQYNNFIFLRLVQVLGCYGLRGLIEKKEHFITSLPFAFNNLLNFVKDCDLNCPILLKILTSEKVFDEGTSFKCGIRNSSSTSD